MNLEQRATPWGLTFGTPDEALRPAQEAYTKANPPLAAAALWLWHDFFEEAHALAQDDPSPEGSYWHAILHRREPDAFNARYWFRRVGSHPVRDALGDADAFLRRSVADAEREWRMLYEFCQNPA